MTPRGESKTTSSYHNKSIDGKGPNRNRLHANHRQKAKVTVGTQKNGMGLGKEKDMFVFRATASPSKVNGLGHSPFPFSNASNFEGKKTTGNEIEINALSFSKHGEIKEVGNILQGKNRPNWRRDNLIDKKESNKDLGGKGVRPGADACVEEHVPLNGEEQEIGVPFVKERDMGNDPEPMVEICHG